MKKIKVYCAGLFLCFAIAVVAWFLGGLLPVVGGPVSAILIGATAASVFKNRDCLQAGINFTSKRVLQYAVILLGFGMNLSVVLETGQRSLPIIATTIAAALATAYALYRALGIPERISVLVGVGSSICGGSAIAATAPVIGADDGEVAQAVSVIFFFNVLAAVIFPAFGAALGFSTVSGEAFGIFAGTAINDTSSVTAAAATWDSLYGLGSSTLDMAVTVKLTRTLAIIPITLALAALQTRASGAADGERGKVSLARIFPSFILWFAAASLITTVAVALGVPVAVFAPAKTLSKFLILAAMAAIGLNTDIVRLVRTGGRPLIMGFCCWVVITAVSLAVQRMMGIW